MEIFKKNKKILFLLIFLGIFGITSTGFALELDWPTSPGGTYLNENSTLPQLIEYLYEWGITIGGLVTFIALVSAGFQYLTSVGDPSKMKEATSNITSAVLGLTLLLSSWLILNTINPELTTFNPGVFDISSAPDVDDEMNFTIDEAQQCDYIILYSEENFKGKEKKLDLNEETSKVSDHAENFSAKSVRAYNNNNEECGTGACGCYIEVAAGSWFFGLGCGDVLGQIPAHEKSILRWTRGTAVNCVKLLPPG